MSVAIVPRRIAGVNLQGVVRKNLVLVKKKKQGVELVGRKSRLGDQPVGPNRSIHQANHSGVGTCRPWGCSQGRTIAMKISGRHTASEPRKLTRMQGVTRRNL